MSERSIMQYTGIKGLYRYKINDMYGAEEGYENINDFSGFSLSDSYPHSICHFMRFFKKWYENTTKGFLHLKYFKNL